MWVWLDAAAESQAPPAVSSSAVCRTPSESFSCAKSSCHPVQVASPRTVRWTLPVGSPAEGLRPLFWAGGTRGYRIWGASEQGPSPSIYAPTHLYPGGLPALLCTLGDPDGNRPMLNPSQSRHGQCPGSQCTRLRLVLSHSTYGLCLHYRVSDSFLLGGTVTALLLPQQPSLRCAVGLSTPLGLSETWGLHSRESSSVDGLRGWPSADAV